MIVALSWVWNTGKTTAINKLKEDLEAKWIKVSVYSEIARGVLEKYGNSDIEKFQLQVMVQEMKLMETLKNDKTDIILKDRTATDWYVYWLFNNVEQIKLIGEYDLVILFTTPFKETTTEWFTHYNNKELEESFEKIIWEEYNPVKVSNWSEYDKIKQNILDKYYEKPRFPWLTK